MSQGAKMPTNTAYNLRTSQRIQNPAPETPTFPSKRARIKSTWRLGSHKVNYDPESIHIKIRSKSEIKEDQNQNRELKPQKESNFTYSFTINYQIGNYTAKRQHKVTKNRERKREYEIQSNSNITKYEFSFR